MTTKKRVRTAYSHRTRGVKSGAAGGRVRKNMDMDPAKLQAAQAALGTKSETETVDRALDLVLGRARFDAALDRVSERGGFRAYDEI